MIPPIPEHILRTQDLVISRRILNGERALLELLLRHHHEAVAMVMHASSHDTATATRGILETYREAVQNLYQYYGQCSFRVWLLSIAVRKACAHATPQPGWQARPAWMLRKRFGMSVTAISECFAMPPREIRAGISLADKEKSTQLSLNLPEEMKDLATYLEAIGSTPAEALSAPESSQDSPDPEDTMNIIRHEHRENLMVCNRIRNGFVRGIEMPRIKKYAQWYWQNCLMAHFINEERVIFPLLGRDHQLVKKALAEHRRLKRLFESKSEINKMLSRIEEELAAHVRFEEKVLFKELENNADAGALRKASLLHGHLEPAVKWEDEFWRT